MTNAARVTTLFSDMRLYWLLPLVVAAACGEGTDPTGGVRLTGQAVPASTASSPTTSGVQLTLATTLPTGGSASKSASLDTDGRFVIDVPDEIAEASSITATIDASPSARVYRPVILSASFDTLRTRLGRPLLVQRSVNVPATSTFAGNRTVSLFSAFTPPCSDLGNINCDSFYPQRWLTNVALWPEAELPVPLAFDRVTSVGPITDADSVALWNTIAKMHADLGRVVFRPSMLGPGVRPDSAGYVSKTVLVRVDSNLIGVGGVTSWIWDANDNIIGARTRVPRASSFSSPVTLPHELMHALGFTHTCAWPSLMGGHGCVFQQGLQAGDVGAFTLAYAVKRALVSKSPTTNLGDARRGETQVEGFMSSAVLARRPVTPMGAAVK